MIGSLFSGKLTAILEIADFCRLGQLWAQNKLLRTNPSYLEKIITLHAKQVAVRNFLDFQKKVQSAFFEYFAQIG